MRDDKALILAGIASPVGGGRAGTNVLMRSRRARRKACDKEIDGMIVQFRSKIGWHVSVDDLSDQQREEIQAKAEALHRKWRI